MCSRLLYILSDNTFDMRSTKTDCVNLCFVVISLYINEWRLITSVTFRLAFLQKLNFSFSFFTLPIRKIVSLMNKNINKVNKNWLNFYFSCVYSVILLLKFSVKGTIQSISSVLRGLLIRFYLCKSKQNN